jgi:hypothetical protein
MKRITPVLFLLLAKAFITQAQTDLQNTGILYVSTGTDTLYINGAFTNTAAGALTNNGHLYIRQNLTNSQASMAIGSGSLYLTGSALQTVAGSQPFKTFNLVTSNSAGITLNSNLDVNGVHTFTSGIITTSATPNYLIYESGASYTGDGDSRHVLGWVKKTGSTNFAFPVGNGTFERRAALENLSASSEFNARYLAPTPNTPNFLSPLWIVDPHEYWEINRVSGGTALVHLNWDDSKVEFPAYFIQAVRVAYFTGGFWTDQGGTATGDVFATGDVTSNTMNSFGLFTFASNLWTLPLNFISITAERKQGKTLVSWKTAQEYNVDHFEVERSNTAGGYGKIGNVPALNSSTGSTYTYTDLLPLQGIAYYRIHSIDRDGKGNYSAIVAVSENDNGTNALYLVNNPVKNNIHLFASDSYKGIYRYKLFNGAGQLVQAGQLTLQGGVTSIPLLRAVTQGVYTFDLQNDMHRFTRKIIIQ